MVQKVPSWPDQFSYALGQAGWSEDAIEDAIIAVRTQCGYAGQGPRREFGDADSYARRLIRERSGPPKVKRNRVRDIAGLVGGIAGIVLASLATDAARAGTDLSIRTGGVVIAVALLGFGLLALVWSRQIMAQLSKGGPVPVLIVALVSLVVLGSAFAFTPTSVISVSWPIAALVAVGALCLSVLASWPHRPQPGRASTQVGGTDSAPPALQWLLVFLYPLAALLLVLITGIM